MVERRGGQAPSWRSLSQAGAWLRHFLPSPGHCSEEGAMRTVSPPTNPDDQLLGRFGYRQQFRRSLGPFESFGIGFSFISVTMALFVTYGFLLSVAGPRGIWVWPIALAGQTLVCLVCATMAAKIPVAGVSYQWGSRLANPTVGWWLGWLAFMTLVILTVSVDYAFVQLAFQPMLGIQYTPLDAAVQTSVVLAVQAALIIGSTVLTTRVNNVAVVFEVVGMVELATLLGSFTLLGFEHSANLAEETHEPRRVVPKAMIRALLAAGVVGMIFLIAVSVAVGDVAAT